MGVASAQETEAPQDATPDTCDRHGVKFHKQQMRGLARAIYAEKKWRDSTPAKPHQHEWFGWHIRCLYQPRADRALRQYKREQKRQFYRWRGYRLIANTYCGYDRPGYYFTGAYLSCGTIDCESGNWQQGPNSASASGAYQIISSTWYAYGGGKFASAAYLATPREQSIVASRIHSDGDQWDC